MSEAVFIKDVIKGLKFEYPTKVVIGRRTAVTSNPETGQQTVTNDEITVRRAIKLPINQTLAFLQAMGAGVKGMELLSTTVQIAIDLDDVRKTFNLKGSETYARFDGQRYEVIDSEVYEYAAVLFCRAIP